MRQSVDVFRCHGSDRRPRACRKAVRSGEAATHVLAATVEFDTTVFSTPTSIDQGPIVPDATGFLPVIDTLFIDASYDSLFSLTGDPVNVDGVFWSFDLTAVAEGTSDIAITFAFADAVGANVSPVTTGDPLSVVVVPEPSSSILFGISLLFFSRSRRASGRELCNTALAQE
ncbi:MAG: PEP-CTERM sorting domain-containing protein [Planctomycetota bacterium]